MSKHFTTGRIIAYSLMALVCICSTRIVEAQGADVDVVKLDVKEISEKAGNYGCAPAAAANVLGWWATGAGKELFPTSAGSSDPSAQDVQDLLIRLNENMGTDETGGTGGLNVASGIRETLKDYEVDGQVGWYWCTWLRAKAEIDAGRPFIAGLSQRQSVWYDHYVCVTGYVIYTDNATKKKSYSLLFHDGYGEGETDFAPAEDVREEYWLLGLWNNFWYNPLVMYTIKLKENKSPCDASQYLNLSAGEEEINTNGNCSADLFIKNTSPTAKIKLARYSELRGWECAFPGLLGFCNSIAPGAERTLVSCYDSVPAHDLIECREDRYIKFIAVLDTDSCEDQFTALTGEGTMPAGFSVIEYDPDVCRCNR